MSVPTPQLSSLGALDSPQIPPSTSMEPVTLEDVESGKVDVQSLMSDVGLMKTRLNDIRSQMDAMLAKMASVDESVNPQTLYNDIQALALGIKSSYDDFNATHRRIDPLIQQQLESSNQIKQ